MNITEKLLYSIQKKGRGWVFTPKNFLKIRHYNTINPLLDRLEKRGYIRSLGKGLYDYPIIDKETGEYKRPALTAIISALEIQYGEKLQYGGEYSAYLLGLKETPESIVYLTNGRAKNITISDYNISIKRTNIPTPPKKSDKTTVALQAFVHIGKDNITPEIIKKIYSQLNEKEYKRFKSFRKFMPAWLNNLIKI